MPKTKLDEFNASDGVSQTADPVGKDSSRPADKHNGEAMPQFFTKVEVINQIMGQLSNLGHQELADVFKGLTDKTSHDKSKALGTRRIGGTAKDDSNAMTIAQMRYSPTSVAAEEVMDVFSSETLSEESQEKIRVIFEAALNTRMQEEVIALQEEFEVALEEALVEKVEAITENIDKYLTYAVEQWIEDNELAVESGLKSEVTESFIYDLRNLFEKNYVMLPEEKVDLCAELVRENEELANKYNNAVSKNLELQDVIEEFEAEAVFEEAAEDLPLSQREKLRAIAEGIEYEDVKDFARKLSMIKENYTGGSKPSAKQSLTEMFEVDEENPSEDEVVSSGPMSDYLKAISRTTVK